MTHFGAPANQPASQQASQPANQHVPPCRMGRKSARINAFSHQNQYSSGWRSSGDFCEFLLRHVGEELEPNKASQSRPRPPVTFQSFPELPRTHKKLIHHQASPIKDHRHQVTKKFGHLSPSALLSSNFQISLIPSWPPLLGLLPLRPLFPLPRQFQSASLDVDVSPRRSPSQQHILARLMRTTYTNTLALERLTSKHWNAEGVPLRAEGALLCRDMRPPPI